MKSFSFFRALLGVALCMFLAAGVTLTGSDSPAHAAAAKKAKAPATESLETVQKKLDAFCKKYADDMNRLAMPSKAKKAVAKNPNGTFTATYREIDHASFETSFAPPKAADAPKSLKYIATIRYDEVEYQCTAKTQAEALQGPFTGSRQRTTEWIKYLNGKWTN